MKRWIVYGKPKGTARQFIGVSEGVTLEDAIMNGMIKDHQFKVTLRRVMPLDKVDKVTIYGVPKKETRSTYMDSEKLTHGEGYTR